MARGDQVRAVRVGPRNAAAGRSPRGAGRLRGGCPRCRRSPQHAWLQDHQGRAPPLTCANSTRHSTANLGIAQRRVAKMWPTGGRSLAPDEAGRTSAAIRGRFASGGEADASGGRTRGPRRPIVGARSDDLRDLACSDDGFTAGESGAVFERVPGPNQQRLWCTSYPQSQSSIKNRMLPT